MHSKFLKLEHIHSLPNLSSRIDIETLDVSGCNLITINGTYLPPRLKHLNASNNQIKYIFTIPYSLQTINLRGNRCHDDEYHTIPTHVKIIDDTTVEENELLTNNVQNEISDKQNVSNTELDNIITDLQFPNPPNTFDLGENIKIDLRSIDDDDKTKSTRLYVDGTRVACIEIPPEWKDMDHVEIVNLFNCKLTHLDGSKLPKNLKKLMIVDCDTETIISLPESLQEFVCKKNKIEEIDLSSNINLIELNLQQNQLKTFILPPFVQYVDVSKNKITTLSDMFIPDSVTTFICHHNKLKSFPSHEFKKVTYLLLNSNDIERFILPDSVQICDISFNDIDAFPTVIPTTLTHFNIEGNYISILPKDNHSIVYFNCGYNELTNTATFKGWTALKVLDASRNKKITSFIANDFTDKIRRISANQCNLSNFSCSSKKLTHLDISENKMLHKIELNPCRNLDYIDVSDTPIRTLHTLPFVKMTVVAEKCDKLWFNAASEVYTVITENTLDAHTYFETVIPQFDADNISNYDSDDSSVVSINSVDSWENDKYSLTSRSTNSYAPYTSSYCAQPTRRHVVI